MQGLFTATYVGVGQGLGGLVGGLLMQRFGGAGMFAMCSAICAAGWAACGAAERAVERRGDGGGCGPQYSVLSTDSVCVTCPGPD